MVRLQFAHDAVAAVDPDVELVGVVGDHAPEV